MRPRSITAAFVLAVLALTATAARADQSYRVNGKDSFRIGASGERSEVAYDGRQTLTVTRSGGTTKYTARVEYTKVDQGAKSRGSASYTSAVLPTGEQRDGTNHDPDYLTVLNQPFAVALDGPTLRELAKLRGRLPFSFPSPMTGAPLRGYLQRSDDDGGIPGSIGVTFDADGPMKGALPDHPELGLAGRIRMKGVAYYDPTSALLLALDATLTITGRLDDRGHSEPVAIEYKRTITAESAPMREARR